MFARHLRTVLKPLVWTLAALYLLIDAISMLLLRPIARWLSRISESLRLTAWIRTLGPYASLALFLVPLVVLEPAKPISVFLMGTGHKIAGVAVLVTGEGLKILFLERIFQITRPKLMSFRWFAWAHERITRLFAYMASLAFVKITRVWIRRLRAYARRFVAARRASPA
jgi:hypothetical protein